MWSRANAAINIVSEKGENVSPLIVGTFVSYFPF